MSAGGRSTDRLGRRLRVPVRGNLDGRRPCVTSFLPERHGRRGKRGIVECADRNAKARGACLARPTNSHAAVRTEMMIDSRSRVAGAGVDLVRTIETHVLFREIGITGPGHAGASL